MALTDSQKQRLNESMPIANELKLGDIIQNLQSSEGGSLVIEDGAIKNRHIGDGAVNSRTIGKGSVFLDNLNSEVKTILDDYKSRIEALEGKGSS
ncbi:hypothetical protein [Niallia circulans]|uniref:hypothetical protein n=1 Tax=Niallia circulans TaxID=1397 RepID=UPI0026F0349A|nr:hypothetical protein [Niallia circulans]